MQAKTKIESEKRNFPKNVEINETNLLHDVSLLNFAKLVSKLK